MNFQNIYLVLEIYFVEAKYPRERRFVLQSHDQQWQQDYTLQGRQNRQSLYYGIDNSEKKYQILKKKLSTIFQETI